jgi:hypothetical protein
LAQAFLKEQGLRGADRAGCHGVRFGRPPKLNAHLARREKGETLMDIARELGSQWARAMPRETKTRRYSAPVSGILAPQRVSNLRIVTKL